jgi:AP2 domain.
MPSFTTTDKHHITFQVSEEDRDLVEAHLIGKGKWNALVKRGRIARNRSKKECETDPSIPRFLSLHRAIASRMGIDMTNQIDHINRDSSDNQRNNLRAATSQQNHMNQTKQTGRSSLYKGVSWKGKNQKWQAYGNIDRHFCYLGVFLTEMEAAKAYDKWAKQNFGEFASLNFSEL